MDRWQQRALQQRTNNIEAIAQAHIDAGEYGAGWLRVDELGNLTRVDPKEIVITYRKGSEDE